MSLASSALVTEAAKQLMLDWEQARVSWRDTKAQEFHDTFLATLPDLVLKANNAIQDAELLIRQVRGDCGSQE